MQKTDRVLTRTIRSEHIPHYDFDAGTNIVDVDINHLWGKIDDGNEKILRHTIRGVGDALKRA